MPRPSFAQSGDVRNQSTGMTFVEIARALGYRDPETRGKRAVFMCYSNAIRKLRARPGALRKLQSLVQARQQLAARRSQGEAA